MSNQAGYGIITKGDGGGAGGTNWTTTGNTGTDPDVNFIGTTDDEAVVIKSNNVSVAQIGDDTISIGDVAGAKVGQGILIDNTAAAYVRVGDNSQGAGNSTYILIEDAADKRYISIVGGQNWSTTNRAYGSSGALSTGTIGLYFTSGTGATSVDISGAFPVGSVLIFSDLDRISGTSNITIDAGGGNTIVNRAGAAQTLVLATNGISVTLQKLTATQWMVIATNA